MFVQMPGKMIHVGILGHAQHIERHVHALAHHDDVLITGRWITGEDSESAVHAGTGITALSAQQIIGHADALIIDAPGSFCHAVAIAALRSARHVFIYPGAMGSVEEATHLIKLAREANVILRAGKTTRGNISSLLHALPDIREINMIELQHDYAVNGTSKSMNSALLADLEVISSLVRARVISIKAKGMCMLTPEPDIVSARLEFDNGCAVNYNCNLVAAQHAFTGTLVMKNRILKYDFNRGELTSWFVHQPGSPADTPFCIENTRVPQCDSLAGELSDFTDLIRKGPAFLSMSDSGFEPYMLTDRILEKVMKTLVRCV
jgi:predicted dehydrogenase